MANDSRPDALPAPTPVERANVIELEHGPLVIPVVAEHLEVSRRVVERGRVLVTKQVEERTEHVAIDPLWQENIEVERVAMGHFVETTPAPRYEGNTLVLPVVEEVLVVEKRLRLREEVRITRRQTQVPAPAQDITLRTETVHVERSEIPSPPAPRNDLHPVTPARSGPLTILYASNQVGIPMANNDMADSTRNPNLAPKSSRKPLTDTLLTDQQRLEQTRLEQARLQTGTVQEQRIPIVEESLQVGKREIETGGVRVESKVVERPVHEQVNLREEHVHVERHAVDRPVQPGDVTAFREGTIELHERAEEAVIAKQARVVEEVVVGKEVGQRTQQINETLRHTEVSVDRFGGQVKTTAFKPFETFDTDFRKDYETNYARLGGDYNRYAPLYRYGYNLATAKQFAGKDWNGIETEARSAWEEQNPGTWEQVKAAVRHGWDRVTGKI